MADPAVIHVAVFSFSSSPPLHPPTRPKLGCSDHCHPADLLSSRPLLCAHHTQSSLTRLALGRPLSPGWHWVGPYPPAGVGSALIPRLALGRPLCRLLDGGCLVVGFAVGALSCAVVTIFSYYICGRCPPLCRRFHRPKSLRLHLPSRHMSRVSPSSRVSQPR